MNTMQETTAIKAYKLDFPESDPNGFAGFRAAVQPMFDLCRADESEPFYATVTVHVLTDMLLTGTKCPGTIYERTPATIASSGSDDILVLFYQNGTFSYEIDGELETVAAEEIAFFDLAQPVVFRADAVDNISLIIARRRLEPLIPSVGDTHGFVLRGGVAKDLMASQLKCLLELADAIPAREAPAISEAVLRLVAACLLTEKNGSNGRRNEGSVSLAQLKLAIENQMIDHDFGPQSLLQQFGISRATLYRLFAPLGGVTAYIAERRLRYALRILSDPASPRPRIKKLAYDLGFKHSTAFSRAFRNLFGLSPSEVKVGRSYPEAGEPMPWSIPPEVSDIIAAGSDTPTQP